jgi:hypothetical protein
MRYGSTPSACHGCSSNSSETVGAARKGVEYIRGETASRQFLRQKEFLQVIWEALRVESSSPHLSLVEKRWEE